LAVAQATLLCSQLNLGAVRRRRHERPLLFALVFDNGFGDRKAAFKRLNGNDPATSCTNLVSFCPIISEFTLLKRTIYAATWQQFDDGPSLGTVAFPNGSEYRHFGFRIVIDNNFCTSCLNMARFESLTPEFDT